MKFTDFFIRRPVFAIVINLLLLVFGLRALDDLQVRQYPDMEIGQLTITTAYPGANAELVQGFVTTPIQETINSVEGIDYIKASSRAGVSMIEVFLKLGYDVNTAMAEMLSKINEVQGRLPQDITDPIIAKASAGNDAIMYIAYQSTDMSETQDGRNSRHVACGNIWRQGICHAYFPRPCQDARIQHQHRYGE